MRSFIKEGKILNRTISIAQYLVKCCVGFVRSNVSFCLSLLDNRVSVKLRFKFLSCNIPSLITSIVVEKSERSFIQ